ncbi:MAG: hypothetical protein NC912_01460 [Candidatus Omnitrophica bacterium]|nr:hypothetical protein [Candidatus Omnitrophota bacterium]
MLNIFLSCLGFLIFLLGLYIFLGRPAIQYERRLRQELKAKQDKIKESEMLIRNFPDPQKALEEIQKKSEELKELGISRKQLPRAVQLLGQIANRLNIKKIISIRPREDIKDENESLPLGVTKTYIEVIVSCPYRLVGEFIKSIAESPLAFKIETLILEPTSIEPQSPGSEKIGKKSESSAKEILATMLLSTYMIWEL